MGLGGFPDKARQVERQGQDITQEGGLGRIGQAETRNALELSAGLVGVAGFGIGEPSETQIPAGGANPQVTRQANGTVRQAQGSGQAEAQRSLRVLVGTADGRRIAVRRTEIRWGTLGAGLAANPFGALALVIVAVAMQPVAMRTKRGAVFIEAAPQTGARIVVGGVMAQLDGAQGFEILMDEGQDLRIAFASVPQHFADDQIRETLQQLLETGKGQQVVVAVSRFERTTQRPEGEETVIDDVEGLGFVAEMRLATRLGGGAILLVARGLVAAGIINIGGLRIASGHQTAVVQTLPVVAIAALLASRFGGTLPVGKGCEAVGALIAAAHAGTGLDELAVSSDREAPFLGVSRKGAVGGDQTIGHQRFDQAVLTSQQPVRLGVTEGHTQRGGAG